MLKLQEVLDFIKNADQLEIAQITRVASIRKSEVNYDVKSSFRVGDIVGIDHKKISPKQNFRVLKINNKNVKVQASDVADGRVGGIYTVSPGLLIKK
jgi:ribosomal protein S17